MEWAGQLWDHVQIVPAAGAFRPVQSGGGNGELLAQNLVPQRYRTLTDEDYLEHKARVDAALARYQDPRAKAAILALDAGIGGGVIGRRLGNPRTPLHVLDGMIADVRRLNERLDDERIVGELVAITADLPRTTPKEEAQLVLGYFVPSLVNEPELARELGIEPEWWREVHRLLDDPSISVTEQIDREVMQVTVAEYTALSAKLDRLSEQFAETMNRIESTVERVASRFPEDDRVREAVDRFIAEALSD
jgi:hypothetical protein